MICFIFNDLFSQQVLRIQNLSNHTPMLPTYWERSGGEKRSRRKTSKGAEWAVSSRPSKLQRSRTNNILTCPPLISAEEEEAQPDLDSSATTPSAQDLPPVETAPELPFQSLISSPTQWSCPRCSSQGALSAIGKEEEGAWFCKSCEMVLCDGDVAQRETGTEQEQAPSQQLPTPEKPPRRRGKSTVVSKKELALKFFSEMPDSAGYQCGACVNVIMSSQSDRTHTNLIRHLESPHTHPGIIGDARVHEHFARILLKSESLTRDQSFGMVDHLLERIRSTKNRALKQSKITRCFQRAAQAGSPELESGIDEGNLHLTDLEFQGFPVLGVILRNQSFKSLDDAYEGLVRKLVFQQNPEPSSSLFALTHSRTYRPVPASESRTSCVSKYLPILEASALVEIKKTMEKVLFGSTITDGWSSRPGNDVRRFTGLCVVWIDWPEMTLKTHLLHFQPHQSSHTAQNLSDAYLDSIRAVFPPTFRLANQTCDNAPNETQAARYVLESRGFWKEPENCIAHTLQLDLNEFLADPVVAMVLDPILKINSRFVNSPSLSSEFTAYQKSLSSESLAPCSFVKTRWWSSLPCISFYVRRRESILNFLLVREPHFFAELSRKKGYQISAPSFEDASQLLRYLNCIKELSDKLSRESEVTSTRVLPSIHKLRSLQMRLGTPTFRRLSELFSRVSVWSKAAYLHPKGFLFLKSLAGGDGCCLFSETKEAVLTDLQRISDASAGNPVLALHTPFKRVGFQASTLDALEEMLEREASSKHSVLRIYSETVLPLLSDSSPHEAICLQEMLSLLFSIPATQVGVERLFSKASLAFNPRRSSLLNENLQAIVTIQKVFPNSEEGIYRALNAVRSLRMSGGVEAALD